MDTIRAQYEARLQAIIDSPAFQREYGGYTIEQQRFFACLDPVSSIVPIEVERCNYRSCNNTARKDGSHRCEAHKHKPAH